MVHPVRPLLLIGSLFVAAAQASAVTIDAFDSAVTENFDSLAASGTGDALPAGWFFSESGSSANSTYAAGTGSLSTGNTYSFGASGSSERAFGALRSSSVISTIGASITNLTNGLITELAIAYTGEQWRVGSAGRVDRLDFSYSTDAASLTTGVWTDVDDLDFVAPTTSGGPTLDGNAAANRLSLSFSLTGLSLNAGSTLWIRWLDLDASGSDDGLAIDDFSVTAIAPRSSAVPDAMPFAFVAVVVVALAIGGPRLRLARH